LEPELLPDELLREPPPLEPELRLEPEEPIRLWLPPDEPEELPDDVQLRPLWSRPTRRFSRCSPWDFGPFDITQVQLLDHQGLP
jgi:hypothetical protein